jgi:hypothetical protein
MKRTPNQTNELLALIMKQEQTDRVTAAIILDARDRRAIAAGRDRCLAHAEAARTHVCAVTILRETRADLERREITPNSGRHEYRVSGGAWMSAPALVNALGLDRA